MSGYKGRQLLRTLLPGRRADARRSAHTGDDDLLAALLFRVQALESGRSLPPDVRPEQLSEEELIGFWADELSPAAGHHVGRIAVSGQLCAMLTLDIAGFTRPDRDEEVRIYIRKAFYAMLREALHGSGIPWDRCYREDRGDGALVILSPDIPARGIIDPFPERLRALIRVYNRLSIPAARIQVRAAAHIGPVYRDDHGLVGDDINLLCRMLDAEPLHTALADSGAELALAISGYMHDTLVRRHPALTGQTSFQQVNTQVKGTEVNAWIHLPGVPSQLEQDRAGVVGFGAACRRRVAVPGVARSWGPAGCGPGRDDGGRVMIKHATAGAFVFCRFRGEWRLGLVEHPRMRVLACPGGHVEDFETAAEAAVREVEEETGLRGVRMVGMPSPSMPAGFPDTHSLIPLPVWITEIQVPADNHLAEPHVHVDNMWVALVDDSRPAGPAAHPFSWYTCAETAALPMFEDSRAVTPMLFGCIEELASGDAHRVMSSLAVAAG